MLNEVKLKNFKCFKEETSFVFSKINLLTGINGRGKSTLLQSLLLMKQSVEHNEYTNEIILNGNCVSLGTFDDLRNNKTTPDENIEIYFDSTCFQYDQNKIKYFIDSNLKIKEIDVDFYAQTGEIKENFKEMFIRVNPRKSHRDTLCFLGDFLLATYDSPNEGTFKEYEYDYQNPAAQKREKQYLGYQYRELKNLLPDIDSGDIDFHTGTALQYGKEYSSSLFLYFGIKYSAFYSKIHYISADRLGSQEYYKKTTLPKFINIDKKGKNSATVLSALKENLVNDILYLGADSKDLLTQIGEWLSKIFDTKVVVKIDDKTSPFIITITFEIEGKEYKPTNVGFGYSYILPIIISGLIAQKEEILIIENPEAHLHPKAQSELTKFLAKVAATGVQVFIESHSEHILRALQISTISPEIPLTNTDVNILYFQNVPNEPAFVPIPILEDGTIEVWPNDFFDQADKDYKVLFGF